MTSVTIPSSTGPLHGGYPSVREPVSNSESEFETSRNVKRCLSFPASSDSKKRRKQSTPIRIYNNETDPATAIQSGSQSNESTSSDIDLRCPVCQLDCDNADLLQNHIVSEHQNVEFKKEPEDEPRTETPFLEAPLCLTMPKSEMTWGGELPNKDWLNANVQNLPLSAINPMFMAMTQFAPPDNLQMKPIRIFNPDAYCDLCNKEFCNKYFLKTHKANKHGIYSDGPTNEQQIIPQVVGNMKPTLPIPLPMSSSDLLTKHDNKLTSKNVINPYSVAFTNPICNSDLQVPVSLQSSNGPSSSSESEKILPEDQTNEECYSPSNIQTESTSVKNDPDEVYSESMKMSPNPTAREIEFANRLKKIGVMNPKAFCEICNKEYCNKYFLRTHKIKRHGIYIPEDKDSKMDAMGNPWPANIQTSPLNLIMTEQSSVHDRKTTSPNDISCDLCGIRFQNISLAQLHNFTVHSRISAKENEILSTNDEPKKSPGSSKQPPENKNLNAEAISEDLQKLQTMIMQLNELDVTKVSTTCNTCNKEFENKFYLHAHMVTEHGVLMEDVTDFEKSGDSENSNNNTLCDLCGKDLQTAEEMKKHVLEVHSNISGDGNHEFGPDFGSPDKLNNRLFMPGGSLPERRLSVNVTPTSSYCEICNKELCNKYFMKTHMQRMHGIEIENGAQIGGVVCDICNKELCSKYFLRVHKHNTHGIVEYGTTLLQPRKSDTESPMPQATLSTPEPDPALKPGDLADLSHRYFTHFTEVCPICSRRFRSTKWLKAHLVSDHGQAGIDKWAELEQQIQHTLGPNQQAIKGLKPIKSERSSPCLKIPNGGPETPKKVGIQNVLSTIFGPDDINSKSYQCSYCPFTSPLLPLLFIHERSHTIGNENIPIKCPVCPQSFLERELFQRHMFTQHPFLPLPPLFNGSETTGESNINITETIESESRILLREGEETKNVTTPKISLAELPMEVNESLRDVAKKVQLPATYALPQDKTQEESLPTGSPGYVMQAFLLEESTSERRVAPSVVFLPVIQKQPAPLTVTFTLTPA